MSPLEATIRKAIARSQSGEMREAIQFMMPLLRQYSGDAEIQNAMGLVMLYGLDPDQALIYFQRAIDLQPENAKYPMNLAAALSAKRQFTESLEQLDKALTMQPNYLEAMQLRGTVLESMNRHQEALDQAEALIALDPTRDAAWITRMLCIGVLDPGRSFEAFKEAAAARPDSIEIARMAAMDSLYEDSVSEEEVLELHKRFGELIEADNPPRYQWDALPSEIKRVGVVSSDFRDHVVANFAIPLIKALKEAEYQVRCYAVQGQPDEITKKIGKLAPLTMMLTTPTPLVAERIHRDNIDALIDLSGLTGHHRLDLFAMQPAPIQLTMIGYPNTTGMSRMGFRVADSITDPPEQDWQLTEKVLRLDPPFLCFEPTNIYPEPVEKLRLEVGLEGMSPERLGQLARAQEVGTGYVDLDRIEIDPGIIKLVPKEIASTHGVIPVKQDGGVLYVAMSDPQNPTAILQVKAITGLQVVPVVGTEAAIQDALLKYYSHGQGSGTSQDNLAASSRGYVFGSYNNPRKITREVLSVWCDLLEQCTEATIIFKSGSYDIGGYRAWVTAPFAARDLEHRIDVIGRTASFEEHLASYNDIDVLLDTWPYGGTTTTFESLMMGVPFVTLEGESHRSRVGASVAHSLGFPQWTAKSPENYVRAAISLAKNRPGKSELKAMVLSSNLTYVDGYSERLAAILQSTKH